MTEVTQSAVTLADGPHSSEGPWQRLRNIIEGLADGIVIVDRSGVIRFCNPAAARLFNRSPEDLVGTELGTPLTAGETTEMEIVRRGGGDLVYAELRVVDADWEGETVELVSLRDITDRKYADERGRQLTHEREARLQAEAASRAKSDFLAIMSHELRTPLNAILGYSELIELGITGDVNEKMRDQVARIRRSAKHLLVLVNDILDLAKVEAGRLVVANASARVTDAIVSALPLIQPQAQAKNLELTVDAGAHLLPPYIGDDDRVRQILVNLLSNAVKCTEPGGKITVTASVTSTPDPSARLQPRGPHIRLSVADTGSGIHADKLRAIFEPFVQGDTGHTRTVEGSGLGLTIGQRLARAMGGDLTVESTLGEGSTFSLWLPTDPAAMHPPALVESPTAGDSVDENTRRTPRASRPVQLKGLCEVAQGVLSNIQPLVLATITRLRLDPATPMAAGLRTSQVSDHLSTLIADIAGALLIVEEAEGEPTPLLADTMEIQRLVAERHGEQRARLGWTEAALRREYMIIREELEHVVRRGLPRGGPMDAAGAMSVVSRFLDQAEYLSVRTLEKARVD